MIFISLAHSVDEPASLNDHGPSLHLELSSAFKAGGRSYPQNANFFFTVNHLQTIDQLPSRSTLLLIEVTYAHRERSHYGFSDHIRRDEISLEECPSVVPTAPYCHSSA